MAARKEKFSDTVQMANALQNCVDKARVTGIEHALQAELYSALATKNSRGRHELLQKRRAGWLGGV
jgi:hypothetical protein